MTKSDAQYVWTGSQPTHSWIEPAVVSICRTLSPRRVLDVGCGNGSLCKRLVSEGFQVSGCDSSATGIAIARAEVPQAKFYQLDIYDAPATVAEDVFDCVIATEVIEHLYTPQALPSFAWQVLRPGGWIIISTPYHGYVKNLGISLLNRWDRVHTVFWEGGHIKFWSKKTLSLLLDQAGFQVVGFHGVGRFWPVYKNIIVIGQKPLRLQSDD